jgi:hypothetical protein
VASNEPSTQSVETNRQDRRKSQGHLPGYRWLSVLLPQKTFNHLHIQARLSNMSLRKYMENFCSEAWIYDEPP